MQASQSVLTVVLGQLGLGELGEFQLKSRLSVRALCNLEQTHVTFTSTSLVVGSAVEQAGENSAKKPMLIIS